MSRHQNPPSDREQLDKAFMALEYKGYYVRSRYWCCNSCALADLPEGVDKYVFWHEQDDAFAFGAKGDNFSYLSQEETQQAVALLCEEYGEDIGLDDYEEDEDEWKRHNTILRPLYLSWAGDAKVIIAKIREFGFPVEFGGEDVDHVDPDEKIRVLSGRIPAVK